MIDFKQAAYQLNARTIARAKKAMDRELNTPPQRKAVLYPGCKEPINTRDRALRLRKK